MGFRVGIDTGGTFTDAISVDDNGVTQTAKASTTPGNLIVGATNVLDALAQRNGMSRKEFLGQVTTIVHGTTTGTNIIHTRVGPKMGLICTKGHKDVIQIRQVPKEEMYDWKHNFPEVLVPRYLRKEVIERLDKNGKVWTPLDEDSVREATGFLKKLKVESIVVAFLYSFIDPTHEKRAREIIKEVYPEVDVTISSDILPAIGEYERTSTAIINAFIAPAVNKYTKQVQSLLAEEGFKGQFLYIQNNGGVETVEVALEKPATLAMSGPAAGPSAAISVGQRHNENNLLSIDMGGTSFDIAIINDGTFLTKTESLIEGHRFSLPVIDVNAVGAGGGSQAWFDVTGTLKVGPRSAGADPGPACYGKSEEPAVTDADVVLGYIDPDYFLGGEMKIDKGLSEKAIKEKVADRLGVSVEKGAASMYRIINSVMADTVSYTFTRRGYDPRDYVVCCGGAAGGVHALPIARELGINKVLIPKYAPIYCAYGMLGVDLKHDFTRHYTVPGDHLDLEHVKELYKEMEAEGLAVLAKEGIAEKDRSLVRTFNVQYFGQFRGIEVEWPSAPITEKTIAEGLKNFHSEHKARYGHSDENYPYMFTSWGLSAIGKIAPVTVTTVEKGGPDASGAIKSKRQAYFGDGFVETTVYDGDKLNAGNVMEGPCIVEERMTNIVVPPGFTMVVDDHGNYVATDKGN
ncbi:hydantoinase/oxoprolinase family protein [Thermodesulfobacteriota bacterium]